MTQTNVRVHVHCMFICVLASIEDLGKCAATTFAQQPHLDVDAFDLRQDKKCILNAQDVETCLEANPPVSLRFKDVAHLLTATKLITQRSRWNIFVVVFDVSNISVW